MKKIIFLFSLSLIYQSCQAFEDFSSEEVELVSMNKDLVTVILYPIKEVENRNQLNRDHTAAIEYIEKTNKKDTQQQKIISMSAFSKEERDPYSSVSRDRLSKVEKLNNKKSKGIQNVVMGETFGLKEQVAIVRLLGTEEKYPSCEAELLTPCPSDYYSSDVEKLLSNKDHEKAYIIPEKPSPKSCWVVPATC